MDIIKNKSITKCILDLLLLLLNHLIDESLYVEEDYLLLIVDIAFYCYEAQSARPISAINNYVRLNWIVYIAIKMIAIRFKDI